MAERKVSFTNAAQLANTGVTHYWGYTVTTVLNATVTITDSTNGTGTVIDTIPTGTAAGTTKTLTTPIKCTTGLYSTTPGTTGVLLVLFD